jgi:lipid-A-disaccharide synthase
VIDRAPRILLSAGEASGDRLGAGLARALRRQRPGIDLLGMGGEEMHAAGVRLVQHASEVSVVGIVEVAKHLPAIRRAMRRLERAIVEEQPDLVVPVDFPDFNLRLAARAKAAGVPVVYFVSPQVWAWRPGRVHKIRDLVRRMLVLFPFEVAFYRDAGVPVDFVGHPIAETAPPRDRRELARAIGLDPDRPTVALLPGSRAGEVSRILPVLLEAARRLRPGREGLQWLVSAAPGLDRRALRAEADRHGLPEARIHAGDFPEVLAVCTAGAVAAGTASLEAAAMELPIVVVYRMNPVTYAIGRRLVRLPHVALPNLVAGGRVVPELIQDECTPDRIASELERFLDRPDEAERVRRELRLVRERLGAPGAFDTAAARVLDELDACRRGPGAGAGTGAGPGSADPGSTPLSC